MVRYTSCPAESAERDRICIRSHLQILQPHISRSRCHLLWGSAAGHIFHIGTQAWHRGQQHMPHNSLSGLPCLLGTRRTSTGLEICDLLLGQGWHHSCSRLLHSPPLHWARALSLDDTRSSGKSFSEMPSLSHLNLSHFSWAFPNARSIYPNLQDKGQTSF